MDSGVRRNDKTSQPVVIPAKLVPDPDPGAGIQSRAVENKPRGT